MSLLLGCFKEYKELHQAYTNAAVALGIFRYISSKAQHLLMTFLFVESMDERNLPMFAGSAQESEEILQELKSLGLFQSNSASVNVNPDIQSQLKALLRSQPLCTLRTKSKIDKRKPTIEKVLSTTQSNWKKFIDFLIGMGSPPSISILRLLIHAGLISQENQEFSRTSECFRFLLKPQDTQIAFLLRQILADSNDKVRTATFFFNLSIAELGKDYSTKETNKGIIEDMNEIGLIYKHNSKSKRYYASPYILGLLTDSPKPIPATERFLIAETNFRVYAYTQSELHIVLLSYFLKMEYRLPGLVVGSLTRESACNALKEGLHAAQIIEFLKNHSLSLPENVTDQLHLWEKERTRIKDYDSIMLEEFADISLYRSTLNYAQGCGAYLWDSVDRRTIILHRDKAQPVLKYLQSLDRIVT